MVASKCTRLSALMFVAVFLSCWNTLRAETHRFQTEGALHVIGEIVAIDGDRVQIKREDGRVLSIKRSFFGSSSQKYISEWEKNGGVPIESPEDTADDIPNFDVVAAHQELWPTRVALTESIEFKKRFSGRSESIVVPAGTEVRVSKIKPKSVAVEYRTFEAFLKVPQTDVLKRLNIMHQQMEKNRLETAKRISKYPILAKAVYGKLTFHVEQYEYHHICIEDTRGYRDPAFIYYNDPPRVRTTDDSHSKRQRLYVLTDFGNLLDEYVIREGKRDGFSLAPTDIPREELLEMKSLAKAYVQSLSRNDGDGISQSWNKLHSLAILVAPKLVRAAAPLEDVQLLPVQPKPKNAGKGIGDWLWCTPEKVECGDKLSDYITTISDDAVRANFAAERVGRPPFPRTNKNRMSKKEQSKEDAIREAAYIKYRDNFLAKFIQKIEATTQSSSKWAHQVEWNYCPGVPIELVVWGDVVDTVILEPAYHEEH